MQSLDLCKEIDRNGGYLINTTHNKDISLEEIREYCTSFYVHVIG